jgi:hypothetical protein
VFNKIKQQEMTTKLILTVIGLTSISAILVPTYAVPTIKSADIFDEAILSADIKNGEVKNADLANDAVTSQKIKNGEVKAEDLASGVIPSRCFFLRQSAAAIVKNRVSSPCNIGN